VRSAGRSSVAALAFVATALLVAVLLLAACSSGGTSDPVPPDSVGTTKSASASTTATPAATPLRISAGRRGLLLGAAVDSGLLASSAPYRKTLAREYNAVTPENAMKWDTIHPSEDHYDFAPADAIVKFARAHHMAVRGHNLVWYRQVPAWVTDGTWTRAQLEQVLHDHIRKVVGHYRGKIAQWDVVNEAIDDTGQLRPSVWLDVIGPDYIDLAFRWAHEEDPNAKLYYNDYDIDRPGPKADAAHALVAGLQARGVPIDGVGIQAHEIATRPPSRTDLQAALSGYAAMGLDVAITELDVGIARPTDASKLAAQSRVYGDVLDACLAVSRCRTFVTWGFTDRASWIPDEIPGFGDALPFDRDYRPKPALTTIRTRLAGG
jgi:endo-1,4-beta-xylanase